MAVIGAESLAVRREPGANHLIFGTREEDVTVLIVPIVRLGPK